MTNKDEGFTLIELLVVIGIIVALAAVTVPLVTKFAGKGDEGALEAETQTVQTAMDTMMAEHGITAVTANDKGTVSNGQITWTALPAGTGAATLDPYLKKTLPSSSTAGARLATCTPRTRPTESKQSPTV